MTPRPRSRTAPAAQSAAPPSAGRVLALAAFLAALLALDTQVDAGQQLVLGALTWVALALACRNASPELRAQALVVVCVATGAEVVGSLVWGVYHYRLENLPSFVPPAHGLVYLAGVALCGTVGRHRETLVRVALVGVLAWGLAGITVLPRSDVAGAIGAVLLTLFLLWGRAPAIYAGVFLVVAALELYGTALGTWTWEAVVPGTGVTDGNPPSGVASGYVWFDLVALALAPRVLSLFRALRSRGAPRAQPDSA